MATLEPLTAIHTNPSIALAPEHNLESKNQKAPAGVRPECFTSTIQEVLFVLTATVSIGMGSFQGGSTTVITAKIAHTLNMTSAQITWINAAGSLTSGAFLLFFAKIADTFGRRSLLIFAMGAFAISALVAGFSTNAMYMDIMSGLLGLFAAASVPSAVGILGAAYSVPSRRKNYAFACFSAGNPVGAVMGSVLSGVVSSVFNWRASFWLIAIIYTGFFVVSIFTVPRTQKEVERLTVDVMKRFDLPGIFLSMAGIALFVTSLTIASGAPKGWGTGYVIALLILGIVLMVSFVCREGYCKHPLMPLHIWKDRNFSLINIILCLGFMSFNSINFWLSLYMQNVMHYSPLMVAVHLLPQCIGGILVNIVAGAILHKVSNKILTAIGALAFFMSAVLLAIMKQGSSYWAFIFPSLLLGVVGADLQFNVANMYVMSSLPSDKQSLAGGIFNTATRTTCAMALGVSASIYNAESVGTAALQSSLRPYHMVFWFCSGLAALAMFFVPFLTIGTQGHSVPVSGANSDTEATVVEKKDLGEKVVKRDITSVELNEKSKEL